MPSSRKLLPALLLIPTLALSLTYSTPPSPQSTGSSGNTDQITCFEQGSGFVSTAQTNDLVNQFNLVVCQSSPNTPISLKPLASIVVHDASDTIIFQNTLNQVATPPNCGEVISDFQKLLVACFANQGSYGDLLVETAGGGNRQYIIQSHN